jgi:hypothetical protein
MGAEPLRELWTPTIRLYRLPPVPGGRERRHLVIDPTFDVQVGASYDDASECGNGTFYIDTDSMYVYSRTTPTLSTYRCAGARWQVDVPQGATVETAYQEVYPYNAGYDNPNMDIYAHDVDDAPDFNTNPHIISQTDRPRTTASVPWVADGIGIDDWKGSSIEIKSIVQEIVDRPGWAANNHLVLLYIARTDVTKDLQVRQWDYDVHVLGAKLHIEYSGEGPEGPPLSTLRLLGVGR